MSQIKVFYTGEWMSGRFSSIKCISEISTKSFDINEELAKPWECLWNLGNRTLHCKITKRGKIAMLSNHSNIHFSVKEINEASPEEYKKELSFMQEMDGIVFVIDSQVERLDANLWKLNELKEDLKYLGRNSEKIPLVFQINKRDLPNGVSVEEIKRNFTWANCKYVESIATQGIGVKEALDSLIEMIIEEE